MLSSRFVKSNAVVVSAKPAPRSITLRRPHSVVVKSFENLGNIDTTYYIGKGIVLYTMIYCTLNWAHYRRIRKTNEQAQGKEDNDNDNDNDKI